MSTLLQAQRDVLVAALEWMEGAWEQIDGEWGPCGNTLEQEIAEGREPEIAALRTLLNAPPCIGNDPLCPCKDGAQCHYTADSKTKAMQRDVLWTKCLFVGLPPDGYENWRALLESDVITGLYIRAAKPHDWREHNVPKHLRSAKHE